MKTIKVILIFALLAFAQMGSSVPFAGDPTVEACVACKFIWENIEESLVDSSTGFLDKKSRRNPIMAAQAFQYFCRISPDIFFEPCNRMFEKLFFMTQNFMSGMKVKELCTKNGMCPSIYS